MYSKWGKETKYAFHTLNQEVVLDVHDATLYTIYLYLHVTLFRSVLFLIHPLISDTRILLLCWLIDGREVFVNILLHVETPFNAYIQQRHINFFCHFLHLLTAYIFFWNTRLSYWLCKCTNLTLLKWVKNAQRKVSYNFYLKNKITKLSLRVANEMWVSAESSLGEANFLQANVSVHALCSAAIASVCWVSLEWAMAGAPSAATVFSFENYFFLSIRNQ